MVAFQQWLAQTMAIERLCGVGMYTLCLVFSYYLLRNAKTEKRVAFVLHLQLFFLCTMAFFYIPPETADLFRLRRISDSWASLGWENFLGEIFLHSPTPLSDLLLYLCGKSGCDGLLPLLAALVFYSNIFYMLKDLYRKHICSAESLAIGFLLLMASDAFVGIISGVRYFMAVSILVRCFYDEMCNGKAVIKNVPWCVMAALMHSFALVLYILRIVWLLFSQKRILLNISTVAVLLGAIFLWGHEYMMAAWEKAQGYIYGDEYAYSWGYLINFLLLIVTVGAVFYSRGQLAAKYNLSWNQLRSFVLLLAAVAVVFCGEYSMFKRTTTFAVLLALPLVVMGGEEKPRGNYRVLMMAVSCLVLLLSGTRGNLCGYTFFSLWQ